MRYDGATSGPCRSSNRLTASASAGAFDLLATLETVPPERMKTPGSTSGGTARVPVVSRWIAFSTARRPFSASLRSRVFRLFLYSRPP